MAFPLELQQPEVATSDDDLPFTELALDTATGDVEVPPRFLVGAEAFAQRLQVRLQWFLGEWFLDQRQGLPYYQAIFVKNPDLALIASLFRQAILTTPGAKTVLAIELALDAATRTLTIDPLEVLVSGDKVFRAEPGTFIVAI